MNCDVFSLYLLSFMTIISELTRHRRSTVIYTKQHKASSTNAMRLVSLSKVAQMKTLFTITFQDFADWYTKEDTSLCHGRLLIIVAIPYG